MPIEHSFVVSSFHAVKVDPGTGLETLYTPDDMGVIAVEAGNVLRFKDYKGEGYVALNEQLLHAISGNIRLTVNDNDKYILAIQEGESLGISNMAIYSLTICDACSLRYEGLAG